MHGQMSIKKNEKGDLVTASHSILLGGGTILLAVHCTWS
jgi:hypothetical protein